MQKWSALSLLAGNVLSWRPEDRETPLYPLADWEKAKVETLDHFMRLRRAWKRRNNMPGHLSFEMEKDLLIKGWMSHDARWFMAVAKRFGIDSANRLNQLVCRELGQVEMKRYMKTLVLSPAKDLDEFLALGKAAISLYGPDLVEYDIEIIDHQSFKMHLKRCFAYENVVKAGIQDQYECGIFARIQGWIDAQGLEDEIDPPLGKCMMVSGQECSYTIRLKFH